MVRQKVTEFVCDENYPVAQTEQGKLRGFLLNGTFQFLGVRYAQAGRFEMPEKPAPWTGIRDACEYGYCAPDIMGGEPWGWFLTPRRKYFTSEDCQYLNIWTKHLHDGARRPVMVWIHGGGFFGGSGIDLEAYDGEALAGDGDVVAITLNHRLNLYGFLNLSEYGEEFWNSGNLGIADLVAALQWIHDNIGEFGGDPDNVTIMGQSGGGGKILCLMQTPAADGLYQKVIIQSGVLSEEEHDSSKELAEGMLRELGITRESIQKIRTVPQEALCRAAWEASGKVLGIPQPAAWGPTINAYYLGSCFTHGFREETAGIPILIGSNLFELDGRSPEGHKENLTEEEKEAIVAQRTGGLAQDVMRAFRKAYPDMSDAYAGMTDTRFRIPTIHYCQRRIQAATAPVFNYVFAYESRFHGGVILGHGGELPFMFGNADRHPAMYQGENSEKLQRQMEGGWIAFAYSGNPNHPELPIWKPFTEEKQECMIFGRNTGLSGKQDAELLELLKNRKPQQIHFS